MLNARLNSHFAVAAAALSIAAASQAEVITWNINAVIPANIDGLYINIATQTTGATGGTTAGWDINPYGATTLNFFASATSPNPASTYVRTQTTGGPSNLPAGFVVSSTGPFANSTTAVITSAGVGSNGWAVNSINYFGFRFNPGSTAGTVRYGFGALQVGATAAQRTLLFIKWEDTGGPITVGPDGPPPAYDPCASFNPVLASGANSVFVNVDTAQDLALSGCGTAAKANYYKYTAPYTGSYTFSTCSSGAATRLAVFDGCAAGSNQLACNDNACGSSSSLDVVLTSGQVVYVVAGGEGGSSLVSPLSIDVTAPPPPPNPNCASASALQFGDNAVDNAGITGDLTVRASPTTTSVVYKARWYRFTPTVTGLYTFSACGSVNDTKMAIASDCPAVGATFQSIAYNDDACACTSGCGTTTQSNFSSRLNGTNTGIPLTQDLVAGQSYLLVIGGYGSTTAAISANLVIDGPPQTPPCPGDFDSDGVRGGSDLTILLSNWGSAGADLDGDGVTGGSDLTILLSGWGACP
ncbi:MAG: hypothetical protein EBR10_08680 [Planctomycetes bacterium]|nr:hypothetical protein [Planctomycetota bacterium]